MSLDVLRGILVVGGPEIFCYKIGHDTQEPYIIALDSEFIED